MALLGTALADGARMKLDTLSNEQLLTKLRTICRANRRVLAQMLAYLGEVEERRLHLEAACSSMFVYCVRHLGMSEGEASRRIAAARLARRYPVLLDAVARGAINLTSLVLLRDVFTEANVEEIVREASGKSKLDVQRIVASRMPKPDVPSKIRAFPKPRVRVGEQLVPLSSRTYKVQFTATEELRAKLDRAAELMGHSNPNADLAAIVDRALDSLIGDLEKKRFGGGKKKPRKPTKGVSRSVRSEVFARDGERCTFVAADGSRCEARTLLELDHVVPRALGGTNDPTNLRVRCRSHNRYYAEQVFGRGYVEERIASSRDRTPNPFELASRGLVCLGFPHKAVHDAMAIVENRRARDGDPPEAPALLREALALLTEQGRVAVALDL